jgi:hypothetical protein
MEVGFMLSNTNHLLTPVEAAEFLKIKTQTLAIWRSTGRHALLFVKIGSAITPLSRKNLFK